MSQSYTYNSNELYSMILQAIEGRISESDFDKLQECLRASEEARQIYSEVNLIYAYMRRPSLTFGNNNDSSKDGPSFDEMFWQELAEYEKTAPKVEIPRHESLHQNHSLEVILPPRGKRKLSKFGIFTIINAAAMILFFVLLSFTPEKGGVEVATLIESNNAKWINPGAHTRGGGRLETGNEWLTLGEGLVELKFDNNARVVMEGPAKFQLLAEDRIGLDYGKMYTIVPEEAVGFSVYTQNAKIIDMGTEFGVQADLNGSTQLHVLKGKTMLMAGEKANKVNTEVVAGDAKKISSVDSIVSDIECDKTMFARKVEVGKSGHIWRGENISLASIVAGLDGFKEVGSLEGINPATGQYTTSVVMDARASKTEYNLVAQTKFVDGVFVPDGQSMGTILISSKGHTFDCPNTSGLFTHEIAAYKGRVGNTHSTIPKIVSGGTVYDQEPVVLLHSNVGITIDLKAICESLRELDVRSFKASATLTDVLGNSKEDLADVDFWVLVDGEVKYERKLITVADGVFEFEVDLNRQDQFLTLIVTDGLRDDDSKRSFPYGNDFFYLIDPELKLADCAE